jgi:hypothetical protein
MLPHFRMPPNRLISAPKHEPAQKPSLFDVLSRVVLPIALALVATVQPSSTRSVGFAVLAAFALLLSFSKPIFSFAQDLGKRLSDGRAARRLSPAFRQLVSQFGDFVNPNRGSLESLVEREYYHRDSAHVNALRLAPNQIFLNTWKHLHERVQRSHSDRNVFLQHVEELLSLVNDYARYSLDPIYDNPPLEFLESLRPHSRSDLEDFRERFVSYRDRLAAFVQDAAQAISVGESLKGHYISRPKPLQSLTLSKRD